VVAQVGALGRRFLSWWFGELGALIPQRLRARTADRRSMLVVDLDGGRATLRHLARGTLDAVATVDARDGPEAAQECARALRTLRPAPKAVVLRLPAREVLRRVLEVPEAAGENLHGTLGFQLDRVTPFASEEARFDCRVVGSRNGRLRVELAVAARSRVDAATRLLEGWGLSVDHVGIAGATPAEVLPFDLLRGEGSERRTRRFGRMDTILTASAVVLAVLVVALPLLERRAAVAELEGLIAGQRTRVERIAALRREADRLKADRSFLIDRKLDRALATDILLEVTRVVPDGAWLAQFRIEKGQIRLTGYSPAPTAILETVERSHLFQGARFQSTVISDPVTRLDRFEIVADIVEGKRP